MSRFNLGPRDPQQPTETFEQYQERTNAGVGARDEHDGPYTRHFRHGQGDAVDPDVDDYYAETWFEERAR